MAINSYDKQSDKVISCSAAKSICSKSSNLSECHLMKLDYTADDSNTSSNCKHEESKKKNNASPYLTDGKIQMLSRTTEKRLVRKKTNNVISSLPLVVNVYKASSDELKYAKKSGKKVKKSVLTLPNEPALFPQACTVSDMNDSEYFDENKDEHKQKATKRRPIEITRKPRNKSKGIEVLDSVRYCVQRNIDYDSSSTDTINCFTGDGKKVSNKSKKNIKCNSSTNAHDVWTMLRNMNRFQFKPSPPLSLNSTESLENTKNYNKRRNGQVDTKFIETCRTEEFAYISSLIDNTPRNSQSSIDRITVIDKEDDYQGVSEELKVVKHKITTKEKGQKKIKPYIKNKLNIRTKHNSRLAVCDGRYNDELSRFSNVNKLEENCHNKNCDNSCNDSKNETHNFNDREDRISLRDSSGASGNIIKNISDITDPNKFDKLSPNDSQCQINGITKVVLSKGQNDFLTKKAESLKRKPRLVNTIASGAVFPKLTQAEIKRRLAKIKFPIIILAKDQACATFHVTDYEPPQFAGLDEQIWPFMQNWINEGFSKGFVNYNEANKCVNKINMQGMKRDCIEKYNSGLKYNKSIINGNNYSKNKIKNYIPLKDKNATQQVPKIEYINNKVPNINPMCHFKNKMLQFLYKKQPFNGRSNNCYALDVTNQKDVSCCLVDVGTNTSRNSVATEEDDTLSMKEGIKHSPSTMKQAWAKGRWASDFIDNVIKKIKGGVYYQDEKYFSKNPYSITKDGWVQTEMTRVKNDYCYNCNRKTSAIVAANHSCDPLQLILGFDNSLSDLQIELLNKNLIAIRHSITNSVVQFDVALPSQINRVLHLKQPVSCIPVTVTESQTKIFKSKTTIVNAILPAELCSILPKLIRNILDIRPTLPNIVEKVDSNLTPIEEISQNESRDSIKQVIPIQIDISPELRILRQGKFTNNLNAVSPKRTVNITSQISYKEVYSLTVTHLLPNIISNYQVDSTTLRIFESPQFESIKSENQMCFTEKTLICQELQPHIIKNRQIVSDFRTYNFCDFAVVIMNNKSLHLNLNMPLVRAQFFKNNIIIKMTPDKEESSLLIADVKIDSLFNGYQESINSSKNLLNNLNLGLKNEMEISLCPNRPHIKKIYNCKNNFKQCTNNNQNKRSFIKLYKKCRSVSRISNERSAIALNKIKGLDDFFLALGSAKSLVSVIDGGAETKILMSVKEMKYWITSITPRQALLVLLLANKKDTSNLVRYRSVILQAIAVNRITCTSELDMEIEVIESENLNTFSKYEGISYLPASIENQDTLLEELHWIAKTTASDYQRTFDESSQRLLKSLLEKRKKLNPSYLRVMARYVGLGLLKQTK